MYFNVGSLLFGLLAWLIPVICLVRKKKERSMASFASLGCCVMCLVLVVFGLRHEAVTGDFAAIEDTIGALSFAAAVQAVLTLVLNAMALSQREKGV